MRTEPPTIDLGTYHVDPQSDPHRGPGYDPPWPGWIRLRRFAAQIRRGGLGGRRWSAVVAVVLLVAPLAGDVPPVPPRLVPLWAVPGTGGDHAAMAVGAHRLYLVTGTGEGASLTAHRLADGKVEWRSSLGDSVADLSLQVAGSVPVLTSYRPTERTVAYHPDTGQWIWSLPGVPYGEVGGRLLVSHPASTVDAGSSEPGQRQRGIAAVDVRTGRPSDIAWLDETAQIAGWQAPDGAIHVFTLRRDGLLARHALTTDAATATIRTPHRERLEATDQNLLSVVGDLVLVSDRASAPPALAAYDAGTLRHRWTVPRGWGATPCGPVVCVNVSDGSGAPGRLDGVDPATGAVRWSVSCADGGAPPCQIWPSWVPPDRLWIESWAYETGEGGPRTRSWVADAGTGRRLSLPTGWSLGRHRGVGNIGAGDLGGGTLGDGDLLLTRSADGVEQQQAGEPLRIWWARADPTLTELTVLGAREAHGCSPHGAYLVCWTAGEGFEVVRVRRP